MSLNFPNNPNVNDTHTHGMSTWVYDGELWRIQQSSNHLLEALNDVPNNITSGELIWDQTKSEWVLGAEKITYGFFAYGTTSSGANYFKKQSYNTIRWQTGGSNYSGGVYTIPVSGLWSIGGGAYSSNIQDNGGAIAVALYKNNSYFQILDLHQCETNSGDWKSPNGRWFGFATAGDTFDIRSKTYIANSASSAAGAFFSGILLRQT